MGCTSSKVAQKPVDHGSSGHDAAGGEGHQPQEESRPALPVDEGPRKEKTTLTSTKTSGGKSSSWPAPAEQAHEPVKSERWSGSYGEEKEGETVTDESGLQMRTPRTGSDPSLHYAAKQGDIAMVHRLLDFNTGGSNSLAEGTDGSVRDRSVCGTLIADIDERGMWGNTPLLVATQYAHPDVALALIERGANACLENERQATALHYSCAEGFTDVSQALLIRGANVDPPVAVIHHRGVNGGHTVPVTPLSAAAAGGHTELVQLLLGHGVEVDRRVALESVDGKDRKGGASGPEMAGGSALTAAAAQGHTETCLVLIDAGASVLFEDWGERTPLLHAILGSHEQTTLALLDAARLAECERQLANMGELKTGEPNPSGLAPLHAACDKGMELAVERLCAAGADTERRDASGATPLHRACKMGRVDCVRQLLSAGANPGAEDVAGNTPLLIAHRRSDQHRADELLNLIETAIADAERRRNRPYLDEDLEPEPEDVARPAGEDAAANDECDVLADESQREQKVDSRDEDEDVLLVSDWDQDAEGTLDDCVIVDYSTIRGNRWCTNQSACETIDTSAAYIQKQEEEEDILLVDDYDPDDEEEVELATASSPAADGGKEGMRKQETKPAAALSKEQTTPDEAQAIEGDVGAELPKEKPTPGDAQKIEEDVGTGTLCHSSDGNLDDAAIGRLKLAMEPTIVIGAAHPVEADDLTTKLVAVQLAAESVDTAMIAAAGNVVVARPAGGG